MDAPPALDRLGGVADAGSLLRLTSRRALCRAVRREEIEQVSRGRYALPTAGDARAAGALHGVVCLRSAAALHGWSLKTGLVLYGWRVFGSPGSR